MARPFTKGLQETGNGIYAYLQPDGSWGWSNAGLIVDGDQSLLVDTLFDERLTGEMLAAMRDATGLAADEIGTLVNTHANGDHCHGNGLVPQAEIIASAASAAEMDEVGPELLAMMMANAGAMGEAGEFLSDIFGAFDFASVNMRKPTRTFDDHLHLTVGDKQVELINVGPAHTGGDVLVHVPDDRTVFTGDILFIEGTPIMWAGPVSNWIAACDRILAMKAETIVPGHGPITDSHGVRQVRAYLTHIDREARKRFDAGMDAEQAALDISLAEFRHWIDAERIAVNVDTLYREYSGSSAAPDIMGLFGRMARIRKAL
ncbi:MAG: MBL fold metallo-hydrolase [Blastomonas sp.]